ncbi:nickel transporter [Aquabacterium sp.]|uniref:HoxN/HupN/NixA family nickel/cobalt transporter n=1 Tax=Aquabacterium sp. TaxID=1872578 RepID=UPI0035AD7DBC
MQLPQEFLPLAAVVTLLGMKHGFDADHLAAIDGLTRANSRHQPRLARLAGALFSSGHGLVVIAVALLVSGFAAAWKVPEWLEATGAWVSISVLTLLAVINLFSLVQTPHDELARTVGWRSTLFARLLKAQKPWTVAAVGALFALSFDTVSQATLFAITAGRFGGWQPALLLALLFMLGMLLTDGLNGLWIARLIRRSDETARIASRVMTLAVSGISLLTAGVGVALQLVPGLDARIDDHLWLLSVSILVVILGSFLTGRRLARVTALRAQPVQA